LTELKFGVHDTAATTVSSPDRRAILVLGMHRSGTSALCGVFCGLGAAAPKKTLMGADPNNLKGFFEASSVVQAHDAFLMAAGSFWHDWQKFDLQWALSNAAASHSARIKAVLADEFGDEPTIVFKDPRICRFVPYTLAILGDLNMSVVAVLSVRNPLEVALSLQRRDNFAISKSIRLWLRHVLDAEYHSRGMPRYFVSYEGLLRNWRYHVDRITRQIGLAWPDRSARTEAAVDQFLTPELYHARATWDETKYHWQVSELARHVYRVLLEICAQGETKELLDRLDAARAEFDAHCRSSAAATAAADVVASR